jgi:hypothetical protein
VGCIHFSVCDLNPSPRPRPVVQRNSPLRLVVLVRSVTVETWLVVLNWAAAGRRSTSVATSRRRREEAAVYLRAIVI